MPVALAAIDPAALRPHSDRCDRIVRSQTWIHRPIAVHAGVPEIRHVVLLRTARDSQSGRLLVTSYTHGGLAFEAEDFEGAMRRAIEIVPDFLLASGSGAEGIAIVLDEYPSIEDLDLDCQGVKLSDELRRLLRQAGCELVRQGRGDHEIWRNPKTGAVLVVDDGMKSRHIANRILKAAGLPKAF